MKPTQLKAIKAILKTTYSIKYYDIIIEEDNKRLIISPKDTEAFHSTEIIALIEALSMPSYLAYNKEKDTVELHIF